jgi:hypothetical protein
MLGKDRPDVKRYLREAARSQEGARLAAGRFRVRLSQAGIDPHGDDPFRVARAAYDLGGDGVVVGPTGGDAGTLVWRHQETRNSALILGQPDVGKTSAVMHLVAQLARDHTVILPCLRGDYESMVRVAPKARFFVFGEFPFNPLRFSSRVPPSVASQRFSELITDMMDAQQASRRYLNLVLDELDARRQETGHWLCLLDLLAALQDRREPRGSDELRFRNRCIARIDALCRALGQEALAVEEGIDLERLIEEKGLLIFRMNFERATSDVLTGWLQAFVFEHRMWSESKFNQKPLILVLDEQRNLLRWRTGGEVTRFESQITGSRALGICYLIVEQVPSEICKAARVAPHLIMAFRPAGSELRLTADLLGLGDRSEVEALQSLGRRECIVRVGGNRALPPLRVWIPELNIDRSNLTSEERKFYAERSLRHCTASSYDHQRNGFANLRLSHLATPPPAESRRV